MGKNGEYTVRSTYYYTMETLVDNKHLKVEGKWMNIWSLKIPQKIKLLLWRMGRGCLPTRKRLQQKGVSCPSNCPHCDVFPETEWHIFFGCSVTRKLWEEAGLWYLIEDRVEMAEGFNELLFLLLEILPTQKKHDLVIMLWCAWRMRNEKVWEENTTHLQVAVRLACNVLIDWEKARARTDTASAAPTRDSVVKWRKPDNGTLKCNVDAAIFNDQGCFGLGMCLRNDNGEFLQAQTVWHQGIPSAQEAEAMSLWEAINWLREMSIQHVINRTGL